MYSFLLNLPNFYRDFFFQKLYFPCVDCNIAFKNRTNFVGEWLVWGRGLGK